MNITTFEKIVSIEIQYSKMRFTHSEPNPAMRTQRTKPFAIR